MNTINFGIDLGTTNSMVAYSSNGSVQLLKNPVGFKESLPSVVAFKKGRVLVGDKAKEYLVIQPNEVIGSFKRKMGTSELFHFSNETEAYTPEALSAIILKELQNFSIDIPLESAVITIPAAFDTIQSNATKKAATLANLKEIILLQEPIAACLAYANTQSKAIDEDQKWLVYDFGGGTFDVAIVEANERELQVLDHRGNNFLGGVDIDIQLLRDCICPKLETATGISDLWKKMHDEKADLAYKKLGKYLLYKAEESKKELSIHPVSWLEVSFAPLDLDLEIEINQTELNQCIRPFYEASFQLLENLLSENQLSYTDIDKIVMVGGTTYLPYIREQLVANTGIPIDTSIDPTSAVAIGAAFYAGNKKSAITPTENKAEKDNQELKIQVTYEQSSKDEEELIAFKCKEPFSGFYRILRKDGGFDSGYVAFSNLANAFVSILPNSINVFELFVYDKDKTIQYKEDSITIQQGKYQIDGQPLPHDICIEVDAKDETYLELIFKKNELLPLQKTLYKSFSKSIRKNSEESIIINIVEGKVGTMPGANLNIGYVEISGKEIEDDLIKGTDIELHFSITESRDLDIEIYIPSLDQEIKKTFTPSQKSKVNTKKVLSEIDHGIHKIQRELEESLLDTSMEQDLKQLERDLLSLKSEFLLDEFQLLGDKTYQLSDKKRNLLFKLNALTIAQDTHYYIEEYQYIKERVREKLDFLNPKLKRDFEAIEQSESSFLNSRNKHLIKRKTTSLETLLDTAFFEDEKEYGLIFTRLKFLEPEYYTNYSKVKKLLAEGERLYTNDDMKKLKGLCNLIFTYIKESKREENNFMGTGIN